MTRNVLILHHSTSNSRPTTINHLRSFLMLPDTDVWYHHVNAPVTTDLRQFPWDAIILNYCFIMQRQGHYESDLRAPYAWLSDHPARKIALPMDDCFMSALIEDWCMDLGVDAVFTALYAYRHDIYPRLSGRVEFFPALTGYVDVETLARARKLALPFQERSIDVGTRVARSPAAHGRYASLKADYADSFGQVAESRGLNCDLSSKPNEAFVGLDWFRFLGRSKATIGMKGGYGLIDPRGTLRTASTAFLAENPDATYEDIAKACFSGHNHMAEYSCVSPRIFEAAAMNCVQIMPPGEYLECLAPWKHYIPLSLDMREFDDVADALRDEALCTDIALRCRRALIDSGQFTPARLISQIDTLIPKPASPGTDTPLSSALPKQRKELAEFKTAVQGLSVINRASFAHFFMYMRQHKSGTGVFALGEAADKFDLLTVSGLHSSPPLAELDRTEIWSRSYAGQINLFKAGGNFEEIKALLVYTFDMSIPILAFWPWEFADRPPEVSDTAASQSEDLDVLLERLKYDAADRWIAEEMESEFLHSDAARFALFSWSRGDYSTARTIMVKALAKSPDLRLDAEPFAYDAIAAALMLMSERTGDPEGLASLLKARSNISHAGLVSDIDRVCPANPVVELA